MRINNHSSIITEKFYPIIDFILQHGDRYSSLATLYIDETKGDFSRGLCHRIAPELDEIHLVAPSLIELWVRKDAKYPATSEHVMGPVKVCDWNEEVLLVLAHEIAHLNQYYGYPASYSSEQNKEAEESAEMSAIVVLEKWRHKKDFGIG